MKRKTQKLKTTKLQLKKETVRVLADDKLRNVQGGESPTTTATCSFFGCNHNQ